MKYQLYVGDIKMLHYLKYYIDNDLVKICLSNATLDANSIIGYKLAHFREQFNVNIEDVVVNSCRRHVRPAMLSVEKLSYCIRISIYVFSSIIHICIFISYFL